MGISATRRNDDPCPVGSALVTQRHRPLGDMLVILGNTGHRAFIDSIEAIVRAYYESVASLTTSPPPNDPGRPD